jgi:hypothetical protein
LIPAELAPNVSASLRAMKDRGTTPPRCHEGVLRSAILAEEVKNEIFDGATPYSTYVRGVIIDGERGVLLTGKGDSAMVIEG